MRWIAYQNGREGRMSDTDTSTSKNNGDTFRKQFETVFENPDVPIVTVTGWNEWIAIGFRDTNTCARHLLFLIYLLPG